MKTLAIVGLMVGGMVFAQPQPAPKGRPQPPFQGQLRPQGDGAWWHNPQVVERVGLNADQRKKLDELEQQHKLRRIDLNAAMQKAQVTLEPLMNAEQPDESKILAQIDRVSQAQGELRKDEVQMQLGVRRILTADQWRKVREEESRPRPQGPPPQGAPQARP
jgi:Spy/CpxP family protein refolding chaperone